MSGALAGPCDGGVAAAAKAEPCPNARWTLFATILASSLAFIDGSVVNVALPAIGGSLKASAADLQWIVNAYLLPLSALLLLGGAAGDRYGRRRMFLAGILIFTVASLVCAWAPTLEVLLGGRVLQGIGAAMLMPNSLAILGAAFDGEQRGRAIGTWAAVGAIAGAVGPLLGGWLVDAIGWRSIFLVNIPVAAGALFLGWTFVGESQDEDRARLDWTGGVLVTVGLAAITWGLTILSGQSAQRGGGAAMAVGLVALALFVWVEGRRGDRAMMPYALFGTSSSVGLTLLTFLLYGALGGLLVLLPFVLIEGGGYSAVTAGAALLPLPAVIGIASRYMGRIAATIGPRLPLTVGPLVIAGGMALATRIDPSGSYWTTVLPAILVISLGMAGAVAPLTTAVMASVDRQHTGTASGFNSAVARTGGLVATALLGWVLAQRGEALVGAFAIAAWIGAGLCIAAGVASLLLLESRRLKS